MCCIRTLASSLETNQTLTHKLTLFSLTVSYSRMHAASTVNGTEKAAGYNVLAWGNKNRKLCLYV